MPPDEFQRFTARVVEWARTEPRVLGLVALGSTAGVSHRPDDWSDHDLFLIVEPGAAASLRDDASWLPDRDRIVLVHSETEHGRAVVYDDGHLVEFAVFTDAELDVARVNDYEVLLDRCGLGARMAHLASRTASETSGDRGEAWRIAALAKELIVGVSRYARGERISANERVRGTAMRLLVELIHGHEPATSATGQSDNLDPTRRLERTHPDVAHRLASALESPLLLLVGEMVSIVENDVMRGSGDQALVLDAVRAVLQRAQSASRRINHMGLTVDLPSDRRERVDIRLQTNLMAWFTTVSPTGRPDSVPVWFLLRDDDSILVYSQSGKAKLRNIDANPNVALGLDVTDIGRDIIRIEGTAVRAPDQLPADRIPEYVAKYTERIGAIFGTAERFAEAFSEAIVITPRRLHA